VALVAVVYKRLAPILPEKNNNLKAGLIGLLVV